MDKKDLLIWLYEQKDYYFKKQHDLKNANNKLYKMECMGRLATLREVIEKVKEELV